MGSIKKEQIECAKEFENLIFDSLQSEKGIHAETAVAASARMAGTFLFRSFGFPIKGIEPGQPVFSDAANEQGPKLMGLLDSALKQMGLNIDQKQLETADHTSNPPMFDLLEMQEKLEPGMTLIKERLVLSYQEMAESAAICTASIIVKCSKVLTPNVAFKIAVFGMVEGSKTAPRTIKN